MSIDFEADTRKETGVDVNDVKLTQLSELANRQLTIEAMILEAEETLSALKESYRKISETDIPGLMAEIGMSEFRLLNGAKVTLKPFVAGKIDDSNREEAMAWLTQNGHGDIIKKNLVLKFGNADALDWTTIIAEVQKAIYDTAHVDIDTQLDQGVHHATLNAFIKEQMEAGTNFPMQLFKTYVGTKTKITLNK